MTSTIAPVFRELKRYKNINVVDVGAARASFLVELEKVLDLSNVYSIGIDPFDHGVSNYYSKFFYVCVDDVDEETEKNFFDNLKHDQASSLCTPIGDLKNDFGEPRKVKVLNLNDIISKEIPNDTVHFLKIDAEGKDLCIVKSLKEDTLKRIKYIAIECPMSIKRFDDEYLKQECIDYFKLKNFEVFYVHDTDNGSDLSDIVFVNGENL
jgi:FkbM family methyltransferase